MKILNKEIRICEFEWKENRILILKYTHKWEKWEIQVMDYFDDDNTYNYIVKQLRIQVTNLYTQEKLKA